VNLKAFKIGDKVVYPGHGVGQITMMQARLWPVVSSNSLILPLWKLA
jgi:hypothetical protein